MRRSFAWLLALLCLAGPRVPPVAAGPRVVVGSKEFPESVILGEALTMLARSAGADAQHRSNLGGTEIVYRSLLRGDIDLYPDYTGTIAQVMMKARGRPGLAELRAFLRSQGIGMSDPLGFNDGYALAVRRDTARRLGLRRISDLPRHPELRLGFTHEFIRRPDGWAGLTAHYGFTMPNVRGMQHQLAYTAIASGQIDVMEIYTTDAKIEKLGLFLLEDDRAFFPRYDAVLLYRQELPERAPAAFQAMMRLVGAIDEPRMIRANALVELENRSYAEAAELLLREALGGAAVPSPAPRAGAIPEAVAEIGRHTAEHLLLVAVSLVAAILVGIPLGVAAAHPELLFPRVRRGGRTPAWVSRAFSGLTLGSTGVLQTIPSLALLALLIPVFGIGQVPAILALFLYGLLPIVRNTYTGLTSLPPNLTEAADAIGLPLGAQLRRIRLPMASPAIMAGIKTSAVINVGTATIAAFIGAGGLGALIKAGIDLQRNDLLLQGAIPAALLALIVQWAFDRLDHWIIPRGLRLSPGGSS